MGADFAAYVIRKICKEEIKRMEKKGLTRLPVNRIPFGSGTTLFSPTWLLLPTSLFYSSSPLHYSNLQGFPKIPLSSCHCRNASQTPYSLYSRRGLSNVPKPPLGTPPGQKPLKPGLSQGPEVNQKGASAGNLLPKILLGAVIAGAAIVAADETGFLDVGLRRSKTQEASYKSSQVGEIQNLKQNEDATVVPEGESTDLKSLKESTEENYKLHKVEDTTPVKTETPEAYLGEEPAIKKENEISNLQHDLPIEDTHVSADEMHVPDSEIATEDSSGVKGDVMQVEESFKQNGVGTPSETVGEVSPSDENPFVEEDTTRDMELEDVPRDSLEHEASGQTSLPEAYPLQSVEVPETSSNKEEVLPSLDVSTDKEPLDAGIMVNENLGKSEGDKIVLDLIQVIHVAEKRQAESDFHVFQEEKRRLKEEYERELKDTIARELMFAEEASILDKELIKERAKAAATVKMVQDKAEQNLKTELQRKEEEIETRLQKAKELAKAEVNAAIANEKASQLEKIAEANLHINALCMALYARSEESRQSLSIHKLALRTLALQDALSRGFPVRTDVDLLRASLADIKDGMLANLVLSSIPEETLNNGADTTLQLNQKFDALKGTLRHFSLIPPGGGGILTHSLASLASYVKIRERDVSVDGIESTISRVENLLAEGKLSEAADALEEGASGTEAEGAVQSWVKEARNRAITEQALAVIQSYATSISLT